MGKVLSISIFKGGAGKTATAVSLASALSQLGCNYKERSIPLERSEA